MVPCLPPSHRLALHALGAGCLQWQMEQMRKMGGCAQARRSGTQLASCANLSQANSPAVQAVHCTMNAQLPPAPSAAF